jgi:3-methyl-2-oxobutanoate hydroxymethyltransferase
MSLYADFTQRLSLTDIQNLKAKGEKIVCLTAYDASFAAMIDQTGIEIILVGDSLGMVIQGLNTTIPVTLDQMIYHTRCVNQSRQRSFLMSDLPFATYSSPEQALTSAAKLMQEGGADMIKLEGDCPEIISHLVKNGIPVCGHLGLLPQSVNLIGGFKVQGKSHDQAETLLNQAQLLQSAGISLLILECIPKELAKRITDTLQIPVIGIGAGVDCDGQVLVLYDILDIGISNRPRFSANFMAGKSSIQDAIDAYREAVKHQTFPNANQSYTQP